jgi:hypothetical protein
MKAEIWNRDFLAAPWNNQAKEYDGVGLEVLFFIIILSGVRLSPLGTAATTGLFYQPQMIDDGDCGAVGGMKICSGNRSTRRKPAPMLLYVPQIPHDLTRAWTRAAVVGSQRLTAWCVARPGLEVNKEITSVGLYVPFGLRRTRS